MLLFGVRDEDDTIYVLYADRTYERYKLAIIRGSKEELIDVSFSVVEKGACRSKTYVQKASFNGTIREIEGERRCEYKIGRLDYEPLSSIRSTYVDCYYTTYVGGMAQVTVHARGYFYYIYGDKITQIVDLSYDQIHNPAITKCWFRHRSSGVGTVAGSIRSEGHYLLCYAVTSTQWTQYAVAVVDVWGFVDCDGHHTAWWEFACNC